MDDRKALASPSAEDLSRRHALILKSAGEGIYGLDSKGRTTFVNPAAAQMLGWDEDELLGKSQHEVIHHTKPDGSPHAAEECPIYQAFKDGRVHRIDHDVFWRRDGSSFAVEYVSTPILDDEDNARGAVVTFRDVTERRAQEATVSSLQRQNESILRSAGEGIYGLDSEGRTTFVNPAAVEMLGWEEDEQIGKPQHELIHHTRPDGTSYPAIDCPIYAAIHDGAVHRVDDEVFWRKDGSCIPVEYVSTPILDESGRLSGAVVTFRDITERKAQEAALQTAYAEVEALKNRLQAENQYLQREIQVNQNFEDIIGQSDALKKTQHRVEQVAGTDATVLILGETGVGKELFARAVHSLSKRRERPLVKVNCASLPSTLIESELFGHEKGAFTGATSQRIGRFELAHGGSIFLDEIGEVPLDLQSKLLRVLQEGEFERVGGSRTISVDVRIIAATNRNLRKAVWAGDFRDDLYYRLNVFPMEIPPLRDRREDIPQLVSQFVRKFALKMGRTIENIPEHVQTDLQDYDWPGNVRELENVIERAVILSPGGTLLMEESLARSPRVPGEATAEGTLDEVARAHILSVLDGTDWRIEGHGGAADILGMHPNTLRSRMKKLDINKKVGPA